MPRKPRIAKVPLSIIPNAGHRKRIRALLDSYDEGSIGTVQELVEKAEGIHNPEVQKAIGEYRKANQEDWDLKGRGDMDAAEDNFIRALSRAAVNLPKTERAAEWGKAPLSPGVKSLLDGAISAKRPVDAILASKKVEDGDSVREYLEQAGYVLERDMYLPQK
jgi:hypothetical protein